MVYGAYFFITNFGYEEKRIEKNRGRIKEVSGKVPDCLNVSN